MAIEERPLTYQELRKGNIKVGDAILIPYEQITAPETNGKVDVGQRNSEYREISEYLLERPVRWFHRKYPRVTADHVSITGALLTMGGIHLMEDQHRKRKYSKTRTILAVVAMGVGMVLDLVDGKLARQRRSEMTDEKQKFEDEKKGQFKDPFIDGVVETFQYLQSAWTARVLGHKDAVRTILFDAAVSNIPRTLKAIANMFAVPIPETYKPWDPRFWGTSMGRKAPNYAATIAPEPVINGAVVPLAEKSHMLTGLANTKVALERFSEAFWPSSGDLKPMSLEQVKFARYRAPRLAIQSVANIGISVIAGRILK